MKTKKIMTSIIAVFLAITSLSLSSAASQEIYVDVELKSLNANTKIASATKTTSDTSYDEFKWTGGHANSVNVWVENSAGYIIGPKVAIIKDSKYKKIKYRDGTTFQTGATANMYAEQGNIAKKSLVGYANFT